MGYFGGGSAWKWGKVLRGRAWECDEGFSGVEAAGVGTQPADRSVVGFGDPVRESPLNMRFDRSPCRCGSSRPASRTGPHVTGTRSGPSHQTLNVANSGRVKISRRSPSCRLPGSHEAPMRCVETSTILRSVSSSTSSAPAPGSANGSWLNHRVGRLAPRRRRRREEPNRYRRPRRRSTRPPPHSLGSGRRSPPDSKTPCSWRDPCA